MHYNANNLESSVYSAKLAKSIFNQSRVLKLYHYEDKEDGNEIIRGAYNLKLIMQAMYI